ncbi:MAG TPA: ATPase, partial [Cyanobacteria bacterium UBA11691]|nr:ATPase [Cyanobacteria bacterium UBA11691]
DIELLLRKLKKYLNLTWIYEEVPEANSPPSLGSSVELVYPPQEELQGLVKTAAVGYIDGIEAEVARLRALDTIYYPFCDRIMEFISEFDDQGIIAFITQEYPLSI